MKYGDGKENSYCRDQSAADDDVSDADLSDFDVSFVDQISQVSIGVGCGHAVGDEKHSDGGGFFAPGDLGSGFVDDVVGEHGILVNANTEPKVVITE